MSNIQFKLSDQNRGSFFIEDNGEKLAEMVIAISDGNLIVYHTEVSSKLKGQGIGAQLMQKMSEYARSNKLKIVPLCGFVHAQFKRHEDEYKDIWNKKWR